ncbi:MAG: putative antitoxin of bacterial toxin-antitoxin system, YdaS/YdaT [Pseudomonadota bacterium]|jgi:transcriptional regulator with XRE-family HTH domain
MRLGDFLTLKKMPASHLAGLVGVDKSTVGRWVRGESFPRADQLVALERETNGLVTANDFVPARADAPPATPDPAPAPRAA